VPDGSFAEAFFLFHLQKQVKNTKLTIMHPRGKIGMIFTLGNRWNSIPTWTLFFPHTDRDGECSKGSKTCSIEMG
jgi:hypothetical protein